MEVLLLIGLVLLNGVFAMSEVALLTARRSRLKQLAAAGDGLARGALRLGDDPTRFLSTVQIGITSVSILNGIIGDAIFSADLALWLQQAFGLDAKSSGYLATASVVIGITYVSIVAGELVPKRLGQHNAVGIARMVAWPMLALAKASAPFVHLLSGSTNAILNPLLRLSRARGETSGEMTPEEIRTILLEYSNLLPKKHLSMLMNLFDLGDITVLDIMVPRASIESITLDDDMDTIVHQLVTSYHQRLPVFRSALGDVVGVLPVKKVVAALPTGTLDKETLESLLAEPYFVPATTPVLAQMQYFQEKRERLALVVDEYGELMGLVTLEDILEEIIGKFTTSLPSAGAALAWDASGTATAEGTTPVREVNRALGLSLPTDGPKTLNGLIVEHLQDIPEADVSIKVGNVPMEIVHAQGRTIKTVRIFKPIQIVENTATSGA
ncbi:MAG TPA: CNNM domain-containing protein [Burkholderiales bacterium]|jgi:Mg2+/Co2+ transporter CorB